MADPTRQGYLGIRLNLAEGCGTKLSRLPLLFDEPATR
jgi:hypothetical protein